MPVLVLRWGAPLVRVLFWFAAFTGLLPLGLVIEELLPPNGSALVGALLGVAWIFFYSVWPPLCLLLAATPVAMLWKRPTRITLLRPFGDRRRKRPLAELAAKVLAPWGHTYTLSDNHFRLAWYFRSPLLGVLRLAAFPSLTVNSAASYNRLRATLTKRVSRNINWLVAANHVFPVRSSDELWRSTVGALVASSELVVVDVTAFADGVTDELEFCRAQGRLGDVVLVVDPADADAARSRLTGDPDLRDIPLFVWPEQAAERGGLSRFLEGRLGSRGPAHPITRPAVAALGLAAAATVLLLTYKRMAESFLPTHLPALTVAFAPWAEPVLRVYTASLDNGNETMAATAHARLVQRFRRPFLRYAVSTLSDGSPYEREEKAVKDIAALGSTAQVPGLLARLAGSFEPGWLGLSQGEAEELYFTIVDTIESLGGDPSSEVKRTLGEPWSGRWANAVSGIAKGRVHCVSPECHEPLLRALDDGKKLELAAAALVYMRDCRVIPKLFEHIEPERSLNPLTWGSQPFRDGLKTLSVPACMPTFDTFLGDPGERVHGFLVELLKEQPDSAAVRALLPRIDDPVSRELLEAAVSAADTPLLVGMLPESAHREWAIAMLGRVGDERAIVPLFREQERKMPTCTGIFFDGPCTNPADTALSARRDKWGSAIEAKLFDADGSIRNHALDWLTSYGDCDAIPSLLRADAALWANDGATAIGEIVTRNNECAAKLVDGRSTALLGARPREALREACQRLEQEHAAEFAADPDPALRDLGYCALARLAREAAERAKLEKWAAEAERERPSMPTP